MSGPPTSTAGWRKPAPPTVCSSATRSGWCRAIATRPSISTIGMSAFAATGSRRSGRSPPAAPGIDATIGLAPANMPAEKRWFRAAPPRPRAVPAPRPRPAVRSAPPASAARLRLAGRDPVDDALADHDHRRMGAARARNARHHRGVGHPQPLDALDPAILVDDRHRIVGGAHLAGSGHVPGGADGLADPQIERMVIGQDVVIRLDAKLGHIPVGLRFEEP